LFQNPKPTTAFQLYFVHFIDLRHFLNKPQAYYGTYPNPNIIIVAANLFGYMRKKKRKAGEIDYVLIKDTPVD